MSRFGEDIEHLYKSVNPTAHLQVSRSDTNTHYDHKIMRYELQVKI